MSQTKHTIAGHVVRVYWTDTKVAWKATIDGVQWGNVWNLPSEYDRATIEQRVLKDFSQRLANLLSDRPIEPWCDLKTIG